MKTNEILILALMFALLPAVLQADEIVPAQITEAKLKEISVLGGTIILEVSESIKFPYIGIRLIDHEIDWELEGTIKIKKRGEFYITIRENWGVWDGKGKKYTNINDAIKADLKGTFINFYNWHKLEKYGKEVWSAFVKEGGLQLFIDFANEIIDDRFLNSSFNENR